MQLSIVQFYVLSLRCITYMISFNLYNKSIRHYYLHLQARKLWHSEFA